MSFKKILPWLAGILILILSFAAVSLNRLWMFGGQNPGRQLSESELPRRMGGFFESSGPMMGSRTGSLMSGLEVVILPLFFVALFLFTVWAFLKIVRASAYNAARNNLALTGHACPECGRAVAVDWRICPYCGNDLQKSAAPPPAV